MNSSLKENKINKLKEKICYYKRFLGRRLISFAFNEEIKETISRVYVINLDRKPDRWKNVKKELKRIKIAHDKTLYDISRRFSAIDGRDYEYSKENKVLKNQYKLSDQLRVEPNNNVSILNNEDNCIIYMTKQEIAVTMSHIEVWKKMKEENLEYALILEDDIYFTNDFSTKIDRIWGEVTKSSFDILFLSFEYVKGVKKKDINKMELIHKPHVGIWQASGYVLSKTGVEKLLNELPVYGPVDLWLNLKFDKLNALMINLPIIKQRADIESTNSYSIMPVFTKLGLYSEQTPVIMKEKRKLPFILAYGEKNTGLSSLAEALSMIGYTCCSNLVSVPEEKFKKNIFNAYINVGKFDINNIKLIKNKYKDLKIIFTTKSYKKYLDNVNVDILFLTEECNDKWKLLSEFLNIDYPTFDYPNLNDMKQMEYKILDKNDKSFQCNKLIWDTLPWINKNKDLKGIEILSLKETGFKNEKTIMGNLNVWNFEKIECRKDTFPSNLAIFKTDNVSLVDNIIKLKLKKESSNVRNYTAAAIVIKDHLSFGKFCVEIKPSELEGVITGVFLHRNSPHQEIDIEFLGKNHYGFLINVFYNPGIEGTKLEYGYRGTPIWIDLDFDVTKEFHKYEINWTEFYISWKVDNKEVYKRNLWQPTPIPQLPMQFNINVWNTRSVELAGRLKDYELPAMVELKSIEINEFETNNDLNIIEAKT